jgi:hypothetical protein
MFVCPFSITRGEALMLHGSLPAARSRVPLIAALLTALALPPAANAHGPSLDGAWSGSGHVRFASGNTEAARCRVRYNRTSAGSYALRGTCATASGKASQTARLRHIGGNRYEGTFHNREYDVTGSIHVTVRGNRQTVRLISDAGSASFDLRR